MYEKKIAILIRFLKLCDCYILFKEKLHRHHREYMFNVWRENEKFQPFDMIRTAFQWGEYGYGDDYNIWNKIYDTLRLNDRYYVR